MSDTATADPAVHQLDVPGATLHVEVRIADTSTHPTLVMVGYPMGSTGFGSQVPHFTDRTVVTFDPRGIERSTADGSDLPLVEQNVADLHAVIAAFGGDGPVDVFASSGGAITALALAAAHPDDVATLVAHEPPLVTVLDDLETATAGWRAVHDSYQRAGWGAGMAHFIAYTSHEGPFPNDWADQPGPDPAMFGMPAEDDGTRDDPLLSQDETGVPFHRLDVDAVRAAPTRVVPAVGEETGQSLTGRTTAAIADLLGTEVVVFPGGHGGFMGGEYGQPPGQPDAFAATLRESLAG